MFFIVAIVLAVMGKREVDDTTVNFRLWAALPFGIALLFLFFTSVTTVDGGNVGVKKTFGKYEEGTIGPGLHLVAPWSSVTTLDTRTQEYTMSVAPTEGDKAGDDSITATASDQVSVGIDATILYAVTPDSANDLLQKVGKDYQAKLVRPSARTLVRDKATEFTAVELVTTKRQAYAEEVEKALVDKLSPYGITIQDVQIRDMRLPQSIQEAVNSKAAASQKADAKLAELKQAQLDGDIKRTNAKATADSQQIIACGGTEQVVKDDSGKEKSIVVPNTGNNCDQSQLTPEFLQQQYIQAIKELVDAPNNSTLIIPTDQNLTPLLNLPPAGN